MRNKVIIENLEELWDNLDKIHVMLKLLDPKDKNYGELISETNNFLATSEGTLNNVLDALEELVQGSRDIIDDLVHKPELIERKNKVVYGPDIENMDPKKFFKA